MSIAGMNIQPTHHLYFENIEITAKNGVDITDANNIFFKGVKINSPSKFFKLTRTENIINDGTPVK
jgi:hypothetical protein